MHADNEGVDHLDSRIMGGGKCIYDTAPDAGPPLVWRFRSPNCLRCGFAMRTSEPKPH
jgi:hypothetical protein